jgi:Tfp pilus assembly protein PilZ
MEHRIEARVGKKLLLNIDKEGFEGMGLTSNISRNGMFITTMEVFPENSEVSILLGIGDDTFPLKGKVVWSREFPESAPDDVGGRTGIKITEAPEQYLELINNMLPR